MEGVCDPTLVAIGMMERSFVQGLEAIGLDMQAADTEHSYSKDAPNWAATLAAVEAVVEEGQEFVRRQDAAQRPSPGSPAAAQPDWEAALERAVTSVLLWAQSASKAPGAHLPLCADHVCPSAISLSSVRSRWRQYPNHLSCYEPWSPSKAQVWHLSFSESQSTLKAKS